MSPAKREGLAFGLGALHAAARGDRMMWALHRAALSNGIVPVVPAVTVAEGYRIEVRRDRIGELLAGTEVEPFVGESARSAAISSCAMSSSPRANAPSARSGTRWCSSVSDEDRDEISAGEDTGE